MADDIQKQLQQAELNGQIKATLDDIKSTLSELKDQYSTQNAKIDAKLIKNSLPPSVLT